MNEIPINSKDVSLFKGIVRIYAIMAVAQKSMRFSIFI